jgi:hypothetical protein
VTVCTVETAMKGLGVMVPPSPVTVGNVRVRDRLWVVIYPQPFFRKSPNFVKV